MAQEKKEMGEGRRINGGERRKGEGGRGGGYDLGRDATFYGVEH